MVGRGPSNRGYIEVKQSVDTASKSFQKIVYVYVSAMSDGAMSCMSAQANKPIEVPMCLRMSLISSYVCGVK